MAKRKKARRPHRPGPAAWLGAFSAQDGPALALLVVVSYFPALQSIERALALDPDLEIARTGVAEVRRLLAQRAQ